MDGLSYNSRRPQRRKSIDTLSNGTIRLKVLFETICASMVVGRKIRCTWGYCWRIIILRLQKVNATYLNKNLV